ncbi:MAG: hypothetical protein GXP49_17890 [Deltaproteobacteria bacterium]|nr:hypothetical protein [Deltaproteobacteria bacterium]
MKHVNSINLLLTLTGLILAAPACSNNNQESCTPNQPYGMVCASAGGTVTGVGDLADASIAVPARALSKNTLITISAGDEIIQSGYKAAGPPVSFQPNGTLFSKPATFTIPYEIPGGRSADEITVFHFSNKVDIIPADAVDYNEDTSTIKFTATTMGTFEPALSNKATGKRHYTYRAIAGFSMGGASAIALGTLRPDLFDVIAPQGTAVDIFHFLNYLKYAALGGFCKPGEKPTADGSMCPNNPLPCFVSGPKEYFANAVSCGANYPYHFERMDCGGPRAGGFDRDSMIEAFQDMTNAFGNAMSYNPVHPFLPAGVSSSYYWNDNGTKRSRQERCDNPVVVDKIYDRVYNPDGTYKAITFCDGNSDEQGVFDPNAPNDWPTDILLAIDYNGNLKRDPGEPVLFQMSEPFDDVGEDGLADKDEPGFDAKNNPDPANDDYDMMNNPLGTEGNGKYDKGEPYEDLGIDGVACPGDCPWDYGEGNNKFDYNPNMKQYFDFNPTDLIKKMDPKELARIDFYIDVGYRDHLFFGPNTFSFVGVLKALGWDFGIYKGFHELIPNAKKFDFSKVPWSQLPKNILVIYGDRTKSEEEARTTGDGGHVGTSMQVINRALVFLGYVGAHWPGGDYEPTDEVGNKGGEAQYYESKLPGLEGVKKEFFVYEPPGYEPPDENGKCKKRYPVLYSLHGIGMKPEDQLAAPLLFEPKMQAGLAQKFLVVVPDGRCMKDECASGQFYYNTVGWGVPGKPHMDSFFNELIPYVDAHWCTKKPEDVENPPW